MQAIDNVIKSLQLKAPLDIWQPQRDRVPSVGIRDIPGQKGTLTRYLNRKLPPQVGVEKKQPLEIWQPMRDRGYPETRSMLPQIKDILGFTDPTTAKKVTEHTKEHYERMKTDPEYKEANELQAMALKRERFEDEYNKRLITSDIK